MTEYKLFPPKWHHIKVPTTSRDAARAGIALYSPSLPSGLWLQQAVWYLVGLFGPAVLPGRAVSFQPDDPQVWEEMLDQWSELCGPFDDWAIVERRQSVRSGLAVLLIADGHPLSFVRVRPGLDPSLDAEVVSLNLLREKPPSSFWAPEVMGTGIIGDWGYVALTPMPSGLHRPPEDPPLTGVIEEIQECLAVLPRSEGDSTDWKPMHGDFTPWNLRTAADGTLVLLDWEGVGWGPPTADRTLYRASQMALRRGVDPKELDPEAALFWRERLRERAGDDDPLHGALHDALATVL